MFKLTLKLLTLTLLLTVGFLLMSGGRVSALNDNCSWAPGGNWGNHDGPGGGKMSSLVVHAVDSSNGNAPINTRYILNSQDPDHLGNPNLQARIFDWPIGNGRTNQKPFWTGEHLSGNGSGGYNCNGWSVLGTGVDNQHIGNGWVIDCGALGQESTIDFWISHVDNPNGDPGKWVLHDGTGTNGAIKSGDINNDSNPYKFNADNGGTEYLTLEWVPTPPPHHNGGGGATPQCTNLDITGSGEYQTPNGQWHDTYTHYKVTDGYYDGSGNFVEVGTLAEGGDSQYGPNPGHWTPSYTPNQPWVKVYVERKYKHLNGSTWQYDDIPGFPTSNYFNCYSAHCGTQEVDGNVPNGPGNAVIQGTQFKVIMYVTNDGPGTLSSPKLNGQLPDNNYYPLYHDGSGGDTGYYTFYPTAPGGGPQNYTVNFSFADGGVGNFSASCSVTVPVFQHFNINPVANIAPGTNPENPYETDNLTRGISYIVGGDLTEGQTTGATTQGWLTKNGGLVDGVHSTPDSYGSIRHQYDHPDSSFKAGDQYCPNVTISPANGYHGPPGYGDANDQNASYSAGCLTVTNEPFFKIYGSGVSAGNGVSQTNGSCSANISNSGLLAGWNDNFDGPNADRGSGSQLSALALVKITGVASAQTDINRSPTDLTFANTNASDKSTSRASPSLGGNFGGTPICNPPPSPKTPMASIPASPASMNTLPASANGNYQYNGNLIFDGGTVNGATAIYVKGDVYIRGPITYNQAGWAPGSVPSLELIATGNIYVDPGVTQLDGVYIAQPKDATHGGIIYTCATATTPTTYVVNSDYNACHNQLLVNGSFTASKVKLLRTFGSLRDEIPNPGGGGGSPLAVGGAPQWSSAGPIPGMRCTQINEPSDPNTWNDNWLCVPNSSPIHLAWTHFDNSPYSDPSSAPGGDTGMLNADYWKTHGYPYCIKWDVPPDYPQTWQDNSLCLDQNIPGLTFGPTDRTSSGQACLKIVETADPDGQWASGYFLCAPLTGSTPPTSAAPFTNCSNGTSIGAIQVTTQTCAAEVFQFTPELYLTVPAPQPPSKGATQYDAITSLPPVL